MKKKFDEDLKKRFTNRNKFYNIERGHLKKVLIRVNAWMIGKHRKKTFKDYICLQIQIVLIVLLHCANCFFYKRVTFFIIDFLTFSRSTKKNLFHRMSVS